MSNLTGSRFVFTKNIVDKFGTWPHCARSKVEKANPSVIQNSRIRRNTNHSKVSMNNKMTSAPAAAPIVCPGHSRPIVDVRFRHTKTDNLDLLVSACHDKTAQIRWADNGAWIGTYKGHNGAVWSVAIDRAGSKILTGSADFSVKLWDASNGEEQATFPHDHVVKAVDFSPDETYFLTAGLEKKAYVYDLGSKTRLSTFDHGTQVSKATWISPTSFLSGGYDNILRIWDIRANGETKPSLEIPVAPGTKKGICDLEFVPSQQAFITCYGKRISIFDIRSQVPKVSLDVKFDVEAASLSPNGAKVVAGGSDLWLHVFDVCSANPSEEVSVHKGHHGPIFCVRWETTGVSFASGSEDGTIRLWPVSS